MFAGTFTQEFTIHIIKAKGRRTLRKGNRKTEETSEEIGRDKDIYSTQRVDPWESYDF